MIETGEQPGAYTESSGENLVAAPIFNDSRGRATDYCPTVVRIIFTQALKRHCDGGVDVHASSL